MTGIKRGETGKARSEGKKVRVTGDAERGQRGR